MTGYWIVLAIIIFIEMLKSPLTTGSYFMNSVERLQLEDDSYSAESD